MVSEQRYICMRIADLAEPYVPSRELACSRCGEPVWASLTITDYEDMEVFCIPCAQAVIAEEGEEPEIEVRPEVEAELRRRYPGVTTERLVEIAQRGLRGEFD